MPLHIDLSTLTELFRGDRARMAEWIGLYLEEAPLIFERLKNASEAMDAGAVSATAHELKPQAHYLGSSRLHDLLVTIGEQARSHGAMVCRGSVDEVLALAAAIDNELRAELNTA